MFDLYDGCSQDNIKVNEYVCWWVVFEDVVDVYFNVVQ